MMNKYLNAILTLLFSVFVSSSLFAGGTVRTNPPSECSAPNTKCNCPQEGVSANCIKVNIGLGETTPWTGSLGCSLKIFADDDSPSVFTPESLHAVLGGYTFKRLGQKTMADGVTPAEVVLSHPNGEAVHFVFANGESLGRPDPGVHIKMDARLQMVDAEGWATTHDPVYYDLYVGDGTKRRFLATNMTGALGALVSITDERGVVRTPADMGVDIIYDPDGVRQYLTPSRLANVTRTADFLGYDVAVYALQEPPQKNTATGLYIVPEGQTVEHVSVRRENGGKRAVVTIRKGGGDPLRYVFDYAMGDWSLTRSSGVEEVKSRNIYDSRAAQTVTEVLSSSRTMLGRTECNYKWMSWGFAMTNRVEGFGGVTDTTTWTYYTSGNGKGQVKTEKRQSGLLIQYTYDSLDRMVSETRSGPDMMTEVTTYGYTPVDPSDPVLPVDTRPRTVVRKLNNIECERTYYVYSPLTNIVERVGTHGAAYGGTNVLRTVTTFYPVSVGASLRDARSGFVASIRHEDGRLDIYDYFLVSNLWIRTVTHLHEQSPLPVSGKTTRDITLTNARGETTETRTEAFIDGIWYTIARNRMTYNFEGKSISSENLAGQVTTTAWDCCHKVSEVQPDGSTTTWDYDEEGRMIASSRLIPLDMTNVTWLTTCYEYDDLGRQTATWQTNYAAQVGLPVTRTRYDQLGRVKARVDQLGNTTTTTYSPDGRTVSVRNPNTSTRITTRSADGDTLSITGSAVTPEFHTYGILPDGTRWSRIVQGETADSPRFTKRYENLIGQTIREERSGFQGAVLATTHTYDSLGRLVSTSADYEPTVEYTYDVLGNRVATTKTVGGDDPGAPQFETTEWRKSESLSHIAIIDGDIWLTQTNIVSCSDTAIAPLVSSSMRQLTGLTAALPSCSRTTDIRGNVTVNETQVNSSIVTSRQTLPYATNKPLSFSRYGVLLMEVSVSAVTNTYEYNALGLRVMNIDGRGNATRTEYNTAGLRSDSIDALDNRTTYVYDQFGNLVAVTNASGKVIVYEYDLRMRKVYEGGSTYPVRYNYDIFGNKISMMTYRDESLGRNSGDVTTWLYDEASNCLTNKSYADGKGPSYDYAPNGNITSRIWARGVITDYVYDGWGEVVAIDYSDDTPDIMLSRNASGNVTNVIDGYGTLMYFHDEFGQIREKKLYARDEVGEASSVVFHRDAFGRDVGYSLAGSRINVVRYSEKTGRVSDMYVESSGGSFVWDYLDGSDLKSRVVYPNGDSVEFSYERRRDVLVSCSNGIHSVFTYTHNELAQATNSSQGCYFYDDRGAIVSNMNCLGEMSLSYDDAGNRRSCGLADSLISYGVNELNQYVSIDVDQTSHAQIFDEDGNQLVVVSSTGEWEVQYDAENRPVKWERKDGSATVNMMYDWVGRRMSSGDKRFSYIGYKVVGEYIWDPTEGVFSTPLMAYRNGRCVYLFHDGHRNVVSEVADLAREWRYDAYGRVVSGASEDRIGYSSEYYDKNTGMIFYPFRVYDPYSGRWLQRDPAGENISPLMYVYAKNDPIGHADYLGLAKHDCRKSNSTFTFSKKFKGSVLPPISIFIQRSIEDERCIVDCDKCRKGYSIERRIVDSEGVNFYSNDIGPVVIWGIPFYFGLSVDASGYGERLYSYDSCSDKTNESLRGCFAVSVTATAGPCIKVGRFIKYCAKGAVTLSWDSCGEKPLSVSASLYVEQCYFGQCWTVKLF